MISELDLELESGLAQLPADERLRVLGQDYNLQRELGKKRLTRRALARLPPAEKLRILEDLRVRRQIQLGTRRIASPSDTNLALQSPPAEQTAKMRKLPISHPEAHSHHFGGRANAGGVNYEQRVAAFIAVKMLVGYQCTLWEEIDGSKISAIIMQAPEPVDDIVVRLASESEAAIYISAKQRADRISLTANSPAFADTVRAFVEQFLKLSVVARSNCRLVWAVPTSAGPAMTHELAQVLDTHRKDAGDLSLDSFLVGREAKKKKALTTLKTVATDAWEKQSGTAPTEAELRSFLRLIYVEVYDFGCGQRHERLAENDLRSHLVVDPDQAKQVWEKLEHFFADSNQRGFQITAASLRKVFVAHGLALKSPPGYGEDIKILLALTERNLARLKEHDTLRFGLNAVDEVHIPRPGELSALLGAAKSGHLLITGEPGCGKSGLIHQLVETLKTEGLPVVLLLAEEIWGLEGTPPVNPPGLTHPLDEVLAHWPDGARGFLITDALDAVRDVKTQKMLRRLLHDVQTGKSGWTVVASVREYDLQFGRELREAFPAGVCGYNRASISGVAHFYLDRLSETQLDGLVAIRSEIEPFIVSARQNPKSSGLHRSPFYLRLAAELLHEGVNSSRLADWTSPALLLRKFWEASMAGDYHANQRTVTLGKICQSIVNAHSMTLSLKELCLEAPDLDSVNELRKCGIFQAPAVRHGMPVGGDEIRFAHHLLHDYAIARSLVPETPERFAAFVIREPLVPVFYRQSVLFALEELWDLPDGRKGFWEATLKLEGMTSLYGITRILAPIIAARRVETLADLQPLLAALESSHDGNSPALKALRHLASGVQDASEEVLTTAGTAWCSFAEKLAGLLPQNASSETPLVHILAKLNQTIITNVYAQRLALNAAGRGLLANYVAKEFAKSWPYSALVAIETVSRNFGVAPTESELALLALLTPQRVAQFPHTDLSYLSDNLKYIGPEGDKVVLHLFDAAFSTPGPAPGQYEDAGSAIMSLRFQTSNLWGIVRYPLTNYYESRNGENASLLTEIACIVWNAVAGQRPEESVLATISFRGWSCNIFEDYSHISGRGYHQNENRIFSHFEKNLREWAVANDAGKLNTALDRLAAGNRSSLVWQVFLEVGAEYPLALGILLEDILNEPLFLTHLDYLYGGTALLGALHKAGDIVRRERLEKLVVDLPNKVKRRTGETHEQATARAVYAQNRLLGALEGPNIVLEEIRDLWRARQAINPLPVNHRPEGARVFSHTISEQEFLERNGVNLNETANKEMLRLRDSLKIFQNVNNPQIETSEIERNWPLIPQCEQVLKRHAKAHPQMAEELWGHLVGACEKIVGQVTSWPKTDQRWNIIRRILLKAATDKLPLEDDANDTKDEGWPSWGWPAPRLDAARGLPFLAHRLGHVDNAVSAALRHLCRDKSCPLKFNLADRLAVLEKPASDLTWELMDTFIAYEKKLSVLDALVLSADRLWGAAPEKVKPRLFQIASRAMRDAAPSNHIFESLAHSFLFYFLRTGDAQCW